MKLKVPNTIVPIGCWNAFLKTELKNIKSEWEKRVFLISLFGNSLWLTAVKLPQLLTWQVKITLKECFQSSKLVAFRLNLPAQLSSATETLENTVFWMSHQRVMWPNSTNQNAQKWSKGQILNVHIFWTI